MINISIYPRISNISNIKNQSHNPHILKSIKFPQDIQSIIHSDKDRYGNLYIGNIEAAENLDLLDHYQISSILSCAQGYSIHHARQYVRYTLYVPIQDCQQTEFYSFIDQCVEFITEKLLISNVLVHCVAGYSRSACIVIAYLIKSRRISLEEAYYDVKRQRKIINLSKSMIQQLKKYQLDLNNQGFRKSKFNHSLRIQSNYDASIISRSYFKPQQRSDKRSILMEINATDQKNDSFDKVKSRQRPLSLSNRSESIIDKHFTKDMQTSTIKQKCKSFNIQISNQSSAEMLTQNNQNPQKSQISRKQLKKSKDNISRQEYSQKIGYINSRNIQLNQKIKDIQQRFQNSINQSRINFQHQFQGINLENQCYKMQQNDRTSKMSQKSKRNKAKQVKQYYQNECYSEISKRS